MSTEIKDQSASYGPHSLDDLGNGWVNLLAVRIGHETTATMARADFLAAVEAECGVHIVPADAIVIDRAEVPPVYSDTSNINAGVGHLVEVRSKECNAANLRMRALNLLALAEYLDAHPPTPPVAEADVETLAGLVRDALGVTPETIAAGHLRQGTSDQVARYLLATDQVSVTR